MLAQTKLMQNEVKMTISEMNFVRKTMDEFKDDMYKLAKAPSEEEFLLMRGRLEARRVLLKLHPKIA